MTPPIPKAAREMTYISATVDIVAEMVRRDAGRMAAEQGAVVDWENAAIVVEAFPVLTAIAWVLINPDKARELIAQVFGNNAEALPTLSEHWQNIWKEVTAKIDETWAELVAKRQATTN